MGAAPPPALEARGITKRFDGRAANEDVHFVARRGEIRALLGENGAGKTTLISILCGQYQPDEGEVLVHGRPMRLRGPRDALAAGIGVVHQDFRLVDRFTVTENVVLGLKERPGRQAEERLARVAAEVGFDIDPRARVADLGVGGRQRVEILKLLYRGLEVVILDEPTAVLAPQQAAALFAALRRLADAGKAVVFITHRLAEVLEAADQVTVLRQGRVVADRPVAGLTHTDLATLMVGEHVAAAEPVAPCERGQLALVLEDARVERDERPVLDGIDLVVHASEIVGVAGVSGNGQQELAAVAAGVLPLDAGRRTAVDGHVAFIPEDRLATGLVGTMSIQDNLVFRRFHRKPFSTLLRLRPRAIREHALELIDRYRIPSRQPSLATGKLSGGGLQRVIVAREMEERPALLVAAQPTRGLDVVSAQAVRDRIVEARDYGAGVLFISEDLDELLAVSDRIAVLFRGRIVAEFARGAADRAELGLLMAGGGVEAG